MKHGIAKAAVHIPVNTQRQTAQFQASLSPIYAAAARAVDDVMSALSVTATWSDAASKKPQRAFPVSDKIPTFLSGKPENSDAVELFYFVLILLVHDDVIGCSDSC